ncbi:MAG: hypothetical protein J6128_06650 [Clostridia bacterium]|nr:hypothetical protein [Clostridia bacterium]
MLKQWMRENRLQDPDDIDSLLEAADLTRQLIRDRNYEDIHTIILYAIENGYYICFSWIMDLLQEEFEKSSGYFLDDFSCDIGRSIANYDAFVDALQVDFDVQRHDVEKVYDEHGEVAAFFNNFTYNTKYRNIFLGSSENFDTKDNDFIQYKLLFFRHPSI